MEYSVIKWIKNSTVVSGTTTLTVSQLNGLVDGNLTSPAITISGTQKISIFVDTGSRFAISSVRLWMDNSSTVGTTIEYDYTTNVYTGITESDVVFTTASGLAYDPSGYVYASFSYPQDTPRFLRITQTCSGIGDINISEVQVINNEDYVDFGTNGTQTTIKMDHAPIGYESPEPTTVSIYNDTDSLTDATVLIENTGNSVDRMIKICATEDGTFIGREDYTTLPDQIPFENGNFVLSDVISDKIESVAKGNVVPSGTTAFTFEVYDTGMNTEWHSPCHCVGYDSILKKQIFLGMNSWWYGTPWSGEHAPYYGYRGAVHVLFDGYNSFSFINRRSGFPWNSAKSIYWASDNLMAVAGDPVGDYFYSLEVQNVFIGEQDRRTWAIHKFSNFCSTHVLTYSILAYSDTEYWNYCKKLGVGRTCLYTASNLGIAKRSKDTLEKESELTYTSVFGGGGNDFNITACNITGVFVGTSLLDDDVVFVFGPLDNAVNTLFRLSKIRYSTGELIDNTTFNINNACSNLDQIRSMTSDLLDQVWLVYSNGALNVDSTGNLMVFSSSLDLYSNVNYTWFDKVFTVECSPFTGDIYLFVPVWSVTGPPASLGDGDVHDLYSGTIVKVTTASESYSNETGSYYETPVIDIGADYNFSNVEYVEITSGLEHIDKYLDGGTSIIEVRASNVVPEAAKTEGLGESYINSVYLPDVATLNTQIIDTTRHMPCVTYDSNLGYIYLGGTLISWRTQYDQDCLAKCKLSDGTGLTELTKASVEPLFPRRLNCMEYCQDPKDDLYYIYGVCSNGGYYRIKKYDIIANSWSMLVGGYSSSILNNNTKTCYDNINKCIHIMSTSVATGSALYYLYKFDIETETLTDMTNYGVVGSGRLIGAPSTVYYPPSISFINYNGVVRLMGFFDNNSIGSNYYVQFYDPSHPESGWSITTPYVAGTPDISRPSDDSIWDGSDYRWFTGNGTLQAGDKVYKVKGHPGYAWAHTGVHIIGDNTTAGSLVRRFAYYSLTENKWYQLPDLPVGPAGGEHYFGSGTNVYTSQDKLFLLDDDTILYVPLTSAMVVGGTSGGSWHYRSLALIMYKYSINDQAWSSGYLPASGDPVWNSLEYNDVQKDSILMPQGRYVQAKLYFVNSSSASAKIDSITIPSGLIVQDVPPHGYKNMYVKTDIPLDVSVATKTAKLKVWWDLE